MKTILSEKGHRAIQDAKQIRTIDARLISSLTYVPDLTVNDVSLNYRYVHLGPGAARANGVTSTHEHDEIQLEYVLSGTFEFTSPDETVVLPPGDGVLMVSRLPHQWRCLNDGCMIGALVSISGPSAHDFDAHLRQEAAGRIFPIGSPAQSSRLRQVLDVVLEDEPYPWRREMMASLLHLWLAQALNDCFDLNPWKQKITYLKQAAGDRCRAICERAVEFIHANHARPLRLSDIALQAGVTERHLNRLFREYIGESVNAVLTRVRLDRARDLLLDEPNRSVKEVAYACGFSSPSYFTQCFKRQHGKLPREVS